MADAINHSGVRMMLVQGSRRTFLRRLSVIVGGFAGSGLLVACSSAQAPSAPVSAPTVAKAAPPTTAASNQPTAVPAQAPGAAAAVANKPTQAHYWLASNAATPKRGGVFSIASVFAPDTLDVHIAQGVAGWSKLLYEPLLRVFLVDPATGEHAIMPALATSWAQPDPTTIVLKLRQGVKFHDGSEFNAPVAKWNLDRIRGESRSQAQQALASIGSIDALDDYTVSIHLSAPNTAQLSQLGANPMIQMISQKHFEAVGEAAFGKDPSGTGPMRFKSWIPDQKLDLEAFKGYWGTGADGKALPYLDGFTFRVIPDDSVALTDMQSGQLDMYESGIQAQNIPIARADPSMT